MSGLTSNSEPTDSNGRKGSWYVLIAGMPPVATPLELAAGVMLCPLGDRISVFDLAAAGAVGFREWAVLEPVAGACRNELVTGMDAATKPGYDVLNRAWLAAALLGLRGFTQFIAVACSEYSWSRVAGYQRRTSGTDEQPSKQTGSEPRVAKPERPLPDFSGGLLDYHLKVLRVTESRLGPPSEEDATWARAHFDEFNQLAAEDEAFRFALEAVIDWRFATDRRAAIARIWSGLEGLFGIRSELVFRLSSLAASLLEPRGPDRVDRFVQIKKLYAARSKAVHGANLESNAVQRALDGSYALLRDLLLVVIERGRTLNKGDQLEALLG